MRVLITGANGFIGRNLVVHLEERKDIEVVRFTHENSLDDLVELVGKSEFVFHLAGVNRPQSVDEFRVGNTDLTRAVCDAIVKSGKRIPVLYTSSTQAELDNAYGVSKFAAEEALKEFSARQGSPVHLFRLPNVFGKWARPNYNSAVATFCHNISRDLPITINDPSHVIRLVYVDDVIDKFIAVMDGNVSGEAFSNVEPEYKITVGALSEQLYAFRESRKSLITEAVGTGLCRALYSTYLSYLPPESFAYEVPKYGDPRGVFVEMLKTRDSGQFSFFTAHPGVTRGGHYHHSKTEKFLVIKGEASFRFRHIVSGEFYEMRTSGDTPQIVETVPGWTHDITNVGTEEMVVMLWANEIFDRERPDTYARPLISEG
ncbi:SDR family oxidoreductase [Pseudomonas sp. BN417]|uniref:UDP-2-acetamido-2,6-beta-L-arabino-hexul-4-ose reductase n=1 Tax=Pseudomonas sp. BN417 TaxID=2567890 RepID=UPI002456BC82|nr:NAD-dependent epimerase/dehydratase family protein [Pseudomonas sp. BN417]MDH4554967.1 SDR family oxidoreductase [Pseudomonas sp. BN417]